jgi:carboxylate-amine ligase
VPEPTFFWWDVRLQPRFGTVEIRIMDAQTTVGDIAALVALVQCLAVIEATDRFAPEALVDSPEILEENRFLAARDGMEAEFVDPRTRGRVPARVLVEEMVDCLRLHARRLGCDAELELVEELAFDPPAARQRAAARGPTGLPGVVEGLADSFVGPETILSAVETTGRVQDRVASPQPT